MRIVHYLMNVRLRDGGVARAVLDLCSMLAAAGEEVTLLCAEDDDAPEAWRAGGPGFPTAVRIGASGAGGLLPASARRAAAACIARADIVHLHGMWELSNYQIARLCRRAGTPYIYSPHGMLDDWAMGVRTPKKRLVLSLAGTRVLERAKYVHFASAGEMEDSRRRIGRGRGMVVPLVFDWSEFTNLPGPGLARERWPELADGGPVILFLSRVVANKGPDLVIDAAGELRKKGLQARLVIAGDGEPDYIAALRERATALGLDSSTTWTGHVNGRLKLSLFQASDVFVLPTIHENFGFATIEALACGCPAVTTPGNMLRAELAGSGGVEVACREAGALALGIGRVVAEPGRRVLMAERGRAWAQDFLRVDSVVERYRTLYR